MALWKGAAILATPCLHTSQLRKALRLFKPDLGLLDVFSDAFKLIQIDGKILTRLALK